MGTKQQLTAKGIAAMKAGEWANDASPHGAGQLQARKLANGQVAFYFRYTDAERRQIRLPLGSGLTLADARAQAGDLSRRYQTGERDLRAALEAEQRAVERQRRDEAAAEQAAEDALKTRKEATLSKLAAAYVEHLKAAGKPSWAEVERAIERNITKPFPDVAELPAADVTVEDVMPAFHRLTKEGKLREAEKLRSYLRAAYTAARRARNDAGMHAFTGLKVTHNPLADLEVSRPKEAAEKAAQAAKERKWALSEAQLDQLEATMLANQARVAAARSRVKDRTITAPFNGRVGLRNVSLGGLVNPGGVITTLDDLSVVKLDFAVPELFLSSLKPGLTVEAQSDAYPNATFKGRVDSVDTRVDPTTRAVVVRALIDNRDSRLRPGMFMTLRLVRSEGKALMLPETAIVPEDSKHFVFVVAAGKAQKREVTIGRRRPGEVEILKGVTDEDVVVTDGFSGNIALKTAEGTAKLYATWLRHTFRSSWLASLGYLLARGAFRRLRHRTDPRQYNGALFLGLNGICVKSHGGTDGEGFAHAIDVGVDLVIHGFNDKVKQEFSRFEGARNGDDSASTGPTTAPIGIEQPQ